MTDTEKSQLVQFRILIDRFWEYNRQASRTDNLTMGSMRDEIAIEIVQKLGQFLSDAEVPYI